MNRARPRGLYLTAWTFNRGDRFMWSPWNTILVLIDIEEGRGRFVEAKGGSIINGGEIHDFPLDENHLQMLHITKLPVMIR